MWFSGILNPIFCHFMLCFSLSPSFFFFQWIFIRGRLSRVQTLCRVTPRTGHTGILPLDSSLFITWLWMVWRWLARSWICLVLISTVVSPAGAWPSCSSAYPQAPGWELIQRDADSARAGGRAHGLGFAAEGFACCPEVAYFGICKGFSHCLWGVCRDVSRTCSNIYIT